MTVPGPVAFSTLGCPGATVAEIVERADQFECAGVELRCAAGEVVSPSISDDAARRVGATLAAAGIEVVSLASYVEVGASDPGVGVALHRHVKLAQSVGAASVRVFGGDPADPGVAGRAVERLRAGSRRATDAGVQILLETHDAFLTGRAVADVLAAVDSSAVGAIWDVVNPWRGAECIADTAASLWPWLRLVQVKDVASTEDLTPVLPGFGAVPLEELREVLVRRGYAGWVSLEWEAAWYPQAPPLDEALAAFRSMMQEPA